jgi:hypothetical protein
MDLVMPASTVILPFNTTNQTNENAMENKTLKKILWAVAVLGVLGFAALVIGGIVAYKTVNKKVDNFAVMQNSATAVPDLQPYKAEGFIGVPTSQTVTADGDRKKIELKGHWTKGQIPGFEPVSAKDTDKATIVVDRYTSIVKLTHSTKKGAAPTQETIAYDAFKIDNVTDIYLASYGGLGTETVDVKGPAKTLTIYAFPAKTK